jgi:hypothetical protein
MLIAGNSEPPHPLAAYLAVNPWSNVGFPPQQPAERVVLTPWGEDSIHLRWPAPGGALTAALNQVILPPRFSGLWHRDTKDFEVIWTALPIPAVITDIGTRKFSITFKGDAYDCEFGRSSERLLEIAGAMVPLKESNTAHRNLWSFNEYVAAKREKRQPGRPLDEPRSFWIRNVEWSEDSMTELARHINFYMAYFDAYTPVILTHYPKPAGDAPPPRHAHGKFPGRIDMSELDDNLLHFWIAAKTGDSARRFLYYHRILENGASVFVEAEVRDAIRRAICAPNAIDDIAEVTARVYAASQASKWGDTDRFDKFFAKVVSPESLWSEIQRSRDAFATETKFDGGVTIRAAVTKTTGFDDFKNNMGGLAALIREIRNGLSHGKDPKKGFVITPTHENFERLKPWVELVRVAADEVILYKHLY